MNTAQHSTAEKAIFLDRDGVLNKRLPGQYVRNWSEWKWLPGACAALVELSQHYDRIIVITNQQGIGKGLMSQQDVDNIHRAVLSDVETAGGRIDAFYICPHLSTVACACRKPMPGMIEQALRDFPNINLEQSALAGDSFSDLQLGNKLGLTTLWIDTKTEDWDPILRTLEIDDDFYIDGRYEGLAEALKKM